MRNASLACGPLFGWAGAILDVATLASSSSTAAAATGAKNTCKKGSGRGGADIDDINDEDEDEDDEDDEEDDDDSAAAARATARALRVAEERKAQLEAALQEVWSLVARIYFDALEKFSEGSAGQMRLALSLVFQAREHRVAEEEARRRVSAAHRAKAAAKAKVRHAVHGCNAFASPAEAHSTYSSALGNVEALAQQMTSQMRGQMQAS